jgi:hypothetical protein
MAVNIATRAPVRAPGTAVRTAAIVLGVAAITGILTPFGETHLPHSIRAAANSSAPWALIAFASVYFCEARGWLAAVLGASSFVVMDALFYLTYDLRGGYYPHHYLAFWLGIAIIIGPLVGLCASWLRSPHSLLREIAVAAPSAICVGEGVFILVHLPGVSTVYAIGCVVMGTLLFAVLAVRQLRRADRVAISFALCAATASGFYAVYGLLPLVLHNVVP